MRPSLALASAALGLLAAGAAAAQGYDPAFRWRTIRTPHFEIHFHQEEDALAEAVAREAERAHATLVPIIGHAPRGRTQVVLSDDVDDANGSATTIPRNTMRLFAVPPSGLSELNDFEDWLAALVFHEYVHVLHLDAVGGLPRLGNRIFGRLFFPNGLLPAWAVEGLAVLHEANGAPGHGRNASALFDAYARALSLEGEGLPALHELSNPMLEWPRGQTPYLLGGRFLAFLRARHGDAAVRRFVLDQGAQVWPWAPSRAGRNAFGEGFPELWDAFRAQETARWQGQLAAIRARPVTRPALLTAEGGRVESPRWSPDGRVLAWFAARLDERPGLFRMEASGAPLGRGAVVEANGAFTLRSAREAIVAIGEIQREFRLYDDLWRVDLATGRRERLTRGERATDPDLAADGRTLVYVARPGPGRLALVRRDLETGARETLLDRPGTLVYAPRASPDGRRIAFELQEGARRDLAIWADGEVVRLTDDEALDVTPAWSADGRWLFFASDRGGVYNLYAWDAEAGSIRQVTNVETAALAPAPSPDGKRLVFVTYSRRGYDLAEVPVEPEEWTEDSTSPPLPFPFPLPLPCPVDADGTAPSNETACADGNGSQYESVPVSRDEDGARDAGHGHGNGNGNGNGTVFSSREYSPLPTLLPTSWFPMLGSDPDGTVLGVATSGVDVVGRHAWSLQGWWGLESNEPGYSAAYLGGWSWPRLDLSSSRYLDWSPGFPDRHVSVWTPIEAGLTFSFTRLARAFAIRAGWSGTLYDTVGNVLPEPEGIPDAWRFEDGRLSEASLAASFSDAKATPKAISAEEGRNAFVQLRVATPALGSDYDLWRARGAISQYARLAGHAVLALRLAGGYGEGSLAGDAPFRLGGVPTASIWNVLALAAAGTPDQMRGYERRLRGNAFVLANVELRVPLLTPNLGRTTWPLFLRRVHGAAFLDAGDAFEVGDEPGFEIHPFRWDALRFGAGAELRAETFVGYALPLQVRLGYARGLGRLLRGEGPSDDPIAVSQLYLTVGSSF